MPVVARTLRELRLDAGLSLRDLERYAGVNRAVISQIERGRLVASPTETAALAAALELPLVPPPDARPRGTALMRAPTLSEVQRICSDLKLEAENIGAQSYGGQLLLESRETLLWLANAYLATVKLG